MTDMPFPNTVTSKQQGGVRDIVDAATANAPTTKDMSLFNIAGVRALMSGLTAAKSEADAKKKATEIASAPIPEITTKTKIDKSTGQTVHDVTITNFQPGDAEKEVQNAYDEPQKDFQKYKDAARANVAADYHLKQPGAEGQLPEDVAKNKDSIMGRYRLERETGESPLKALMKAVGITALPDKQEKAVSENVARQVDSNRKRTADRYVARDLPMQREADAQRRMDTADRSAGVTAGKETRRRISEAIRQTDFELIPAEDRIARIAAEAGVEPDMLEGSYKATIERQARQQHEKAREKRFSDFRKDSDVGRYETFDKAVAALGDDELTGKEREQLRLDWAGSREKLKDTRVAQERADERIAMAIESHNAPDPPRKLRAFDAESASADALLSAVGDEAFDQTSVKQAISARAGRIQQRLAEFVAKRKGNDLEIAKMTANVFDKNGKKTSAALLNPWLEQQLIVHQGNEARWAEEAATLQSDYEKLSGAFKPADATPTAAKERKFGHAQELGIAAHMKASGYDRATAVKELQDAGKLPK